MNFFGPITHNLYDWYPNKLVCRRFNVPEPYPGSKKEGCPLLDMEKDSKDKDMSDTTIQSIFGATEEDVQKFAQIDKFEEPRLGLFRLHMLFGETTFIKANSNYSNFSRPRMTLSQDLKKKPKLKINSKKSVRNSTPNPTHNLLLQHQLVVFLVV